MLERSFTSVPLPAPPHASADQGQPRRYHRMGRRVAWVAIGSASLGGLLAALLVIFTVDLLVQRQGDRVLNGSVSWLASEIATRSPSLDKDSLTRNLALLNARIAPTGLRLAVFENRRRLAGDPLVPWVRAGACRTKGALGERTRVCGMTHGNRVLVAAQRCDVRELRSLYVAAALGALLLGAAAGAMLGSRLTRWAVAPLHRLTDALRASSARYDRPIELGPQSNCQDVEEVRQVLQHLTSEVQSLLEQAQRFAANAAHELRTPLAAIMTELELMAEVNEEPLRQALERAAARTGQLANLLDRLLLLAMPEGQLSQGFETLSLGDVIQDVVQRWEPELKRRIVTELESEGLLRGDNQLLESLVNNALSNAMTHAATGTITVRLYSKDDRERNLENGLVLEVEDKGPGILSGDRERVFEPFFRVHPNSLQGHGLGLALIGHVARAHGGKARFVDCATGALLRVTLPEWTPESVPRKGHALSSLGTP